MNPSNYGCWSERCKYHRPRCRLLVLDNEHLLSNFLEGFGWKQSKKILLTPVAWEDSDRGQADPERMARKRDLFDVQFTGGVSGASSSELLFCSPSLEEDRGLVLFRFETLWREDGLREGTVYSWWLERACQILTTNQRKFDGTVAYTKKTFQRKLFKNVLLQRNALIFIKIVTILKKVSVFMKMLTFK